MDALIALVAITMYIPHGPVTYCGVSVIDAPPFVAVPVELYESGAVECWDLYGIKADGEIHLLYVIDAIPRGPWSVIQPTGEYLPIAADVPEPWVWFDGLSTVAEDVWRVGDLRDRWEAFR